MLTLTVVQFLAPALLSWLEYGAQRPRKLFQKPDVVRLSALDLLGAEDTPCDVRGREDKFCLRDRDDDTPKNHVSQCPVEFGGSGGTNTSATRHPNHVISTRNAGLPTCAKESAIPGNGYGKGPHPLTENELFVGVHYEQLISRLKQSTENATGAGLMLLASRKARLITEAYFRLRRGCTFTSLIFSAGLRYQQDYTALTERPRLLPINNEPVDHVRHRVTKVRPHGVVHKRDCSRRAAGVHWAAMRLARLDDVHRSKRGGRTSRIRQAAPGHRRSRTEQLGEGRPMGLALEHEEDVTVDDATFAQDTYRSALCLILFT
ncbi:hypothetical protein HPB51_017952 [Rhipicephalus microplus]|uniref:Uncharacterized protein n=1 Tax=Rhipicephalus microplus TaxID=6941 RepID=A0A9J6EPQ3_RHIMP|nr:hypothetical protein HPB51_017952 [Rhipicephalus microplus]